MSHKPSFLDALRNLLNEPDPTGSKEPGASFWDFLSEPEAAEEAPPGAPVAGRAFDEKSFFWAMRNLPITEATKHLMVCGAIGSGKTVTIQLFLQSIAPRFQRTRRSPEQLILFDAKGDGVQLLKAIGLDPATTNFWILNPADPNSAVWNIAEAVQRPALARHFAALLVPEERHTTAPYFTDGARELVYAVLLGMYIVAGVEWTFRDLLCALESQERIMAVASQDKRGAVLAKRILTDDRHAAGILSTIGTKLGQFEQVAALWDARGPKAPRFSIPEFLKQPGVLVLGNDPVLRESFWPINAILLKALTQEILREDETHEPRHWFVLDEFRAMEKIQCMHDLLNRGRSKGASVLLGIQSIDGLMELYQTHGANDILTQCAYKTFLRAGGPVTGEWAQKFFGQIRCMEDVKSESIGHGATTRTVHHNLTERLAFVASFFMNLPLPRRGGPFMAVCDVPCLERFFVIKRTFDEVLSWCIPIPPAPIRTPPSPEQETLRPWTPKEEAHFCEPRPAQPVPAPPPQSPASPASPAVDPTGFPDRKQTKERWNWEDDLPDGFAT